MLYEVFQADGGVVNGMSLWTPELTQINQLPSCASGSGVSDSQNARVALKCQRLFYKYRLRRPDDSCSISVSPMAFMDRNSEVIRMNQVNLGDWT